MRDTYGFNSGARLLLVEGDAAFAEKMAEALARYFERRSIAFTCDWVSSVERSLLQLRYYDYDIAVISMHPAPDENGMDFLELIRQRKYDFPVILVGDEADARAADDAQTLGAIAFIPRQGAVAAVPEAADNGILRYRATREQARLNRDLMEKNIEMKAVNELLARQSVRLLKFRKEQEAQRQRMESLLHAMSDGVVFVNGDREIEMLNPAARRIFRLDPAARFTFADLTAFAGFDPFETPLGTTVPAQVFTREYRVDVRGVENGDDHGGRMLVLRDMTEHREVERLKAEFQSMVSHELRTPLTAIRGAVENFLRGSLGEVTEQQKPFLQMILRNVERQTALVNDMLDLAKLEANMMSPDIAPVEPAFVARLAYESFQYACREKKVKLALDIPEGLPPVQADERMLTQILDNLLSNALKFTPEGGRITIAASTGEKGDEETVRFSVADTGIGVPDHLKEKIFDRYFQADAGAPRQYKGTGLGLAICRRMAELHGGSIACADAPGGGSLFTLAVPRKGALRKKIVLVSNGAEESCLDEELLMREFQVLRAERADAAADTVGRAFPHLVLMEYHLGTADGMEIFRILKGSPAVARIPVIFLGTDLTEQEKVRAFKEGAADVIARPYKPGEFLARVKRVIG